MNARGERIPAIPQNATHWRRGVSADRFRCRCVAKQQEIYNV